MTDPLIMSPIFKQYLWGGETLRTTYGKQIPGNPTAESWEVAAHPNGASVVENGPFAGQPLTAVIQTMGADLVGDNIDPTGKFPLLLKLLDARDKLSVQVHPNDDFAKVNEKGELGKTELWAVLSAKPGATLVYGFRPDVDKARYEQAIRNGTLEEVLNTIPVQAGDVFYIPAGTVHAIGAGIVIAEIQQNSDTTYRVYDYNRKGPDGALRPLHVEKALAVSHLTCKVGQEKTIGLTVPSGENSITYLACCDYFAFERLAIAAAMAQSTQGRRMHILFVAQGEGNLVYQGGSLPFRTGQSILIPAALGDYRMEGCATVLKSYVPNVQQDIIDPLTAMGYTHEQLAAISGLEL